MQAATAAVQGLAGGNMAQAISGAAAPYLAEQIHKLTEGNQEAKAMAHAVVGAVASYASGNSALAGAAGAVSGELMARVVMKQLYPGKEVDDLTETEKQKISALGTLAAGLAGGLAGDSTAAAITGAQAGKNAVENNFLLPAAPVVPVAPPAGGNGEVNPGNGCNGASVCVMTKPDGSVEETPPFTDGPSIVEARDEAAKARDPNVAKELSEAEKAELGGAGSGTPGGWEPQDEENARDKGNNQNNNFDRFNKDDLISSANEPINE
ncbi:VENN motif pre-toxin domain-containing protein [Pantoea sp. FN0302]|uniref:VENN motif pre-toxin domain-containing protein n=1 Tax=Pantoea sp. FN0302 TaxID=3418558 RepID=UPI003CF2E94F